MRYGGHALTRAIVDRVFDHGKRPFGRIQSLSPEMKNTMGYEDFICTTCINHCSYHVVLPQAWYVDFMLSEEDKGNSTSLRYWFELIDIDEDGVIRGDEMRVFYHQQMHRMECLGHEVVPFEDILCQLYVPVEMFLSCSYRGWYILTDPICLTLSQRGSLCWQISHDQIKFVFRGCFSTSCSTWANLSHLNSVTHSWCDSNLQSLISRKVFRPCYCYNSVVKLRVLTLETGIDSRELSMLD